MIRANTAHQTRPKPSVGQGFIGNFDNCGPIYCSLRKGNIRYFLSAGMIVPGCKLNMSARLASQRAKINVAIIPIR